MHGRWRDGKLEEDVIFSYLAIFCMSLQTSLVGDMTTSILSINDKHLSRKLPASKKQWTESSSTWRNFFIAFVISWGLSRSQNYQHLVH
jgi:predicted Co/Zn/Cd cation transporter (cation efflux family)